MQRGAKMNSLEGMLLGKYRLGKSIGSGSFAEVYYGFDTELYREVAVKVLHARILNDASLFIAEARTTAFLAHPYIIPIHDLIVQNKRPFLILEYAPGTLRNCHPRGTTVPPRIIIDYVRKLAGALQYAHDQKLIHRDVNPRNMLLGRHNEILLSDFGLALVLQSSRVQLTQEVAGTPPYMAPEQYRGNACFASDQYALAVAVYEWLCGNTPFQGDFFELQGLHLTASPPPIPGLHSSIQEVIFKALAKDPNKRFPSIQDFAQALEDAFRTAGLITPFQSGGFRESGTLPAPPPGPDSPPIPQHHLPPIEVKITPPPPKPPIWKKLLLPAVIFFMILLVAVGLFASYLLVSGKSTSTPTPTIHSTPTATPGIASFPNSASSVDQTTQAAPSMVFFKGNYYLAFIARNGSNTILLYSSHNPKKGWTQITTLHEASRAAPALIAFNPTSDPSKEELFLAFIANDSTYRIVIAHSSNGSSWSDSPPLFEESEFAPALAVFQSQLYLAFVDKRAGDNSLEFISSMKGTDWPDKGTKIGETSLNAPGLVASSDTLYLAFIADNDSRTLLIKSFSYGEWTEANSLQESSKTAPALTFFDGTFYLAFVANNNTNTLLLLSSSNGGLWKRDPKISLTSDTALALCPQDHLYLAFVAANGTIQIDQSY